MIHARLAASSLVTIRRRVSRESPLARETEEFVRGSELFLLLPSLYIAVSNEKPWRVTFSKYRSRTRRVAPPFSFLLRSSKPHDPLFPFPADPPAHEDTVINQTVLKVER